MKLKAQQQNKEKPPKFIGRFNMEGNGFNFGPYIKAKLGSFMKENPNMAFELKPLFPESPRQRGWFEGAICPLVTFYQEGYDHRDSNDIEIVRSWLKIEFNGDLVAIGGKTHKVAKSTLNQLNLGFLERVTDWLEENYAPPAEALDPKAYKHWKAAIFPYGGPDNYIDYLLERKILKK